MHNILVGDHQLLLLLLLLVVHNKVVEKDLVQLGQVLLKYNLHPLDRGRLILRQRQLLLVVGFYDGPQLLECVAAESGVAALLLGLLLLLLQRLSQVLVDAHVLLYLFLDVSLTGNYWVYQYSKHVLAVLSQLVVVQPRALELLSLVFFGVVEQGVLGTSQWKA